MGRLTIESKSPASVWVDGALIAPTPLAEFPLEAGEHIVKVCFSKTDCTPEKTVTVAAGALGKVRFEAAPEPVEAKPIPVVANTPEALHGAAVHALNQGDAEGAIEFLKRAIALTPTVASHSTLCSIHSEARLYAEALTHCREAHRLDADPRGKAFWEKKIVRLEGLAAQPAPAEVKPAPDPSP